MPLLGKYNSIDCGLKILTFNFTAMMLKKTFFFLFLSGLLCLPLAVSAQTDFTTQLDATAGAKGAGYEVEHYQDPRLVVANGIKTFLTLIGILFLGYTLYAGFLIMTSRGEEEKVTEGKKTLTRAVLGLIVIMSAYSITLLATKIATGDKKHQGDYIEVQDTDIDFQDSEQRNDVKTVGCPLGLKKQPDGTCGSYENAP